MRRREFLKSVSALGTLAVINRPTLGYCYSSTGLWHERMRPLMGSFVGIAIQTQDKVQANVIIDGCFEYIEQIVLALSDYDAQSDLSRLRREKEIALSKLSAHFIDVAKAALTLKDRTLGFFEPLCFDLSVLWRSAREANSTPSKMEVTHALSQVKKTGFFLSANKATLVGGDSGFDFGGIGQGYIADLACEYLRTHGVATARVDCSGDIKFLGTVPWEVEIEDPRRDGEILRTITLTKPFALSSSGDYRNCWFVNGKRYHHLIDPRTGLPGEATQQVTIFHPSATIADALATGLSFIAPTEAEKILRSFRSCGALIVDRVGKVHSIGMENI